MDPYEISIKESLEVFWEGVEVHTENKARELLEEFVTTMVRDDMIKSFRKNLGGQKPITMRFFERCVHLTPSVEVGSLIRAKPNERITAHVVLGNYQAPTAFQVQGQSVPMHHLFVMDGDALAKVESGKAMTYAFLNGSREELYRFPIIRRG